MEVESSWYEALPEQCPPGDAFTPKEFVCYRLCEGEQATSDDFLSHRHLNPLKKFKTPECRARSISVFKSIDDLSNIRKLAAHRHKAVARVTLNSVDGVVKQTGQRTHFSWWRSNGFDVEKATEVVT